MIHPTQDPKYGIKDNKLVNMKTGKPIPDDEPIMIFRAKDIRAADAILHYGHACTNKKHVNAVSNRYMEFRNFVHNNRSLVREPDTEI